VKREDHTEDEIWDRGWRVIHSYQYDMSASVQHLFTTACFGAAIKGMVVEIDAVEYFTSS